MINKWVSQDEWEVQQEVTKQLHKVIGLMKEANCEKKNLVELLTKLKEIRNGKESTECATIPADGDTNKS